MATKAATKDWFDKYAFVVRIDGVVRAAFTTCSELVANIEDIEHREGGMLVAEKSAGLVNFDDITLERGETDDDDLYKWFTDCFNPSTGRGAALKKDYERTFTVDQRDRSGVTVRSWNVFRASVKQYSPGDWDNNANEKKIERVVLRNHGFELAPVTG